MRTDNAEAGWTVLRYTGAMVRTGHAAHRVSCFIKKREARLALPIPAPRAVTHDQ